jgi:hypothetical protein
MGKGSGFRSVAEEGIMDIIDFRKQVEVELIGVGISEIDRFPLLCIITDLTLRYAEDFTRGIVRDLRKDLLR